MFKNLTLRGVAGSLVWGYRTAAELRSWRIGKAADGKWTLTGTFARVDRFQVRQRPLLFTAPREHGLWAWPIETLQVSDAGLTATLGPPER